MFMLKLGVEGKEVELYWTLFANRMIPQPVMNQFAVN